jgi:hypothetical protein
VQEVVPAGLPELVGWHTLLPAVVHLRVSNPVGEFAGKIVNSG